MKTIQLAFLAGCCLAVSAQLTQKRPDPVPILKQISRQNDDGSYSFGYEAGDGSYKIETKFPDGGVQGKYGYVDDSGKLREVEYGASSKRGFEPIGNDINVPPPTENEVRPGPLADGEEDDGQYREDPSIYDSKEYKANRPLAKAVSRRPAFQAVAPVPYRQPAAQQSFQDYQQPAQTFSNYEEPQQTFRQYQQPAQTFSNYQEPARPAYSGFQFNNFAQFQQPTGRSFPAYQQPQYQQTQYQQPQYQQYSNPQYSSAAFNIHPSVKNFDIGTGSYSINYSGR